MSGSMDPLETRSPEAREADQESRLRAMVEKGYAGAPAVRRILDALGRRPGDIATLADLENLPVINRERLVEMQQKDPPYGGFFDTQARVDRIFTSPGPVYEPHLSESDPLWARAYRAAGIGPGDVVLNAFSYHLVAAGLTFHNGLRRVGATVIPSGASATLQQVQLIRDLAVTAYTGTPSFLKAIIDKAGELGHDFKKDFCLRRAVFAAEPLTPALRRVFENEYNLETFQMYGATEVGDVAYECAARTGWHLCEEVLVEIVDSATGRRVQPGELGEVVVTRFNGILFLLRFGTGDLSRLITEPCPCGRTAWRLDGIAGRVGEAVKVRGLFVAPSQLRLLQERFPDCRFQVAVDRVDDKDQLTLLLEGSGGECQAPEKGVQRDVGTRKTDPSPSSLQAGEHETGKNRTGGDGASPFNAPVNGKEGSRPPRELADAFREAFREICTVRMDRVEFLPAGTLPATDKLLIDRRG